MRGNILGFFFLFIGLLGGWLALAITHNFGLACVVGGAIMFWFDSSHRSSTGSRFHPFRGGNLMFIPIWLIGIAAVAYGLIMVATSVWNANASGFTTQATPSQQAAVVPTQLPSAPPTLLAPTPSQRTLLVCVDLAYGYSQPSIQSPHVWQMSQRDGWQVTGTFAPDSWIFITLGDGRSAYMMLSDFCRTSPDPFASLYCQSGQTSNCTPTPVAQPSFLDQLPLPPLPSPAPNVPAGYEAVFNQQLKVSYIVPVGGNNDFAPGFYYWPNRTLSFSVAPSSCVPKIQETLGQANERCIEDYRVNGGYRAEKFSIDGTKPLLVDGYQAAVTMYRFKSSTSYFDIEILVNTPLGIYDFVWGGEYQREDDVTAVYNSVLPWIRFSK